MNNLLSTLWPNNNYVSNLGNQHILNINTSIQGILNVLPEFKGNITPKIVVVGSQSSGKSSVLNGLMSMDVLPTGSSMVTRTPLNIQLIQNKEHFIEFGDYTNIGWNPKRKINLTSIPTENEIKLIRDEIERRTLNLAGDTMGISEKEIHIKINSPNVPNLNLIDLPGLTMVACTDKGQPEDIKIQIRNLIKKYITSNKSLILGVFPARVDIEADIALDLIKEIDKNCDRTIGVLTKIDLMNKETDIVNYLENSISKDLSLKYGYYAIKNRSSKEMKTINIYEGFKLEQDYFKQNIRYKLCKEQNRLGMSNLGNKLSNILIDSIKQNLPDMIEKITKTQDSINNKIILLGNPLPESNDGKITYLNIEVNRLCNEIKESINYRGSKINSGRKIKDIFINYRNKLDSIDSFNHHMCSNEYIIDTIKNCEGNHMSFPLPPIEFIESCLLDDEKNPFNIIINISTECVNNISKILYDLIDTLLSNERISRFNKLQSTLKDLIIKNICLHKKIAIEKIKELIEMEKNYIWTDDNNFIKNLQQLFIKNNTIDNNILRNILTEYFKCIKKILQHIIPKTIMLFLVTNFEKKLRPILCDKIQLKDFYELLEEDNEQKKKRLTLMEHKTRIDTSKKLLDSI
jgi:GTP-binding protein EngB required for normal cell division